MVLCDWFCFECSIHCDLITAFSAKVIHTICLIVLAKAHLSYMYILFCCKKCHFTQAILLTLGCTKVTKICKIKFIWSGRLIIIFLFIQNFYKKKTQTFGTFGLKCKAKRALKELTVNVETRLNGFDPVTPVGILTRNLTFKSCSI